MVIDKSPFSEKTLEDTANHRQFVPTLLKQKVNKDKALMQHGDNAPKVQEQYKDSQSPMLFKLNNLLVNACQQALAERRSGHVNTTSPTTKPSTQPSPSNNNPMNPSKSSSQPKTTNQSSAPHHHKLLQTGEKGVPIIGALAVIFAGIGVFLKKHAHNI